MVVIAFTIWPSLAARMFVAVISIGFLFSLLLRTLLAALGRTLPETAASVNDENLPTYTVLVPLYREANILQQLSEAMRDLDYPKTLLDLKYIIEEDDRCTREAAEKLGLSELVIVPNGGPRTKPKACNYALQFARGTYLVVFDAEDRPDRDQLRKAVAAFHSQPGISCFQARLVIDSSVGGWLQRMFALDYALWFRTLLPGLARARAPIPLGGTSNHFRTEVLIRAGAWDPYNVTEDADLGYRLARLGFRVSLLDSNTHEEAPLGLSAWVRQRTRWLKGYMQTILVHTRDPLLLSRNVGWRGSLIMQAFLGGAVWSALVNPIMWAVFIICSLRSYGTADALNVLARVSGCTLIAANVILAVLSLLGDARRLSWKLLVAVISYPIYWLLISLAAYRALWQLIRDPFRWEKTPHRGTTA